MTATRDWLTERDMAEVAFVLLVDGIDLGWCTHSDVTGIAAAWDTATSGTRSDIRGGLKIMGSIARELRLFDARIQPSSLTFSILDHDETLAPLLFGRARSDVKRTYLAETIDADATAIVVDDITQIPDLGLLYLGLETLLSTAEDVPENTWTVERGKLALFPKAGTDEWARTHEVPEDLRDRPQVTDVPVNWLNRTVALYVCHKLDGVWSAGFPDEDDNDAELLWAGRIKKWSDPAGDGWIDIDCMEVTELLHTSIGTRFFEGTIPEGAYIPEAETEIQIDVAFTVRDYPAVTTHFDRYVEYFMIGGQILAHANVANLINGAFADAFVANSGTYAPTTADMHLRLQTRADGSQFYQLIFHDTADAANRSYNVRVSLPPLIWTLLGFAPGESERPAQEATGKVSDHSPGRRIVSEWVLDAVAPPRKFIISGEREENGGLPFTIAPTNEYPFVPQAVIPDGFAADTSGFLMVNEDRIVAVAETGPNTFEIRGDGELPLRGRRGFLGGTSGSEFSEFISAPVDDGKPVTVRQVWIEPYDRVGRAMSVLLASSGTVGYNFALLDTLPPGMGCGVPTVLCEFVSIEALGDFPWLLVVLKPTPAVKILESMCNVVGAHLVWGGGVLRIVKPAESAAPDELVYLEEANKAQRLEPDGQGAMTAVTLRTSCDYNPESIINRATLKYQQQRDGSFDRQHTVNGVASQSTYGQVKAANVEAVGIYDQGTDIADGAEAWATSVAASVLSYFSEPLAVCERTFNVNLATQLYPGAKLSVDDDGLINPATGRRGVEALLAWAVGVMFDWSTGVGRVRYCFQPNTVTTSDVSRLAPFAPSARVDETYESDDPTTGTPAWDTFLGGTKASGTITGTSPSSTQVGDLLILAFCVDAPAVPSTPSGFTLIGARRAHGMVAAMYYRIATATGTGTAYSFGGGGITQPPDGSVHMGCFLWRPTAGKTLDIVGASGQDDTNNLSWDVEGVDIGALEDEDFIFSASCATGNVLTGYGSESLTADGATLGAGTVREAQTQAGGTWGQSAYTEYPVTADGTGVLDYHFAYTGGNSRGPTVFARVREIGAEFHDGYNAGTKQLRFREHEYTPSDGSGYLDLQWFQVGDEVHIVDLSPADPDAPTEWFDVLAAVDANNDQVTLTTGLAGYVSGNYVMEFHETGELSANQRARGSFIANDTTRSTGVAANDANIWGGDVPSAPVSEPLEQDQPWRRLNNSADDVGQPLSTHKLHELRDWVNTALAYHTAPVYLNEAFPTPATHVGNGALAVTLVGPVWLPLFAGNLRPLEVLVLVAMATATDGGATIRAMTSTTTPHDESEFEEPTYSGDVAYEEETVSATTTYAWKQMIITTPAVVPGSVPGCWFMLDVEMADPVDGAVKVAHIVVREATPDVL